MRPKNQILTFVVRGAVGGAIGWVLVVAYIAYERPFNIMALPYAPFIGAVAGILIGVVIWACFLVARRNLGVVVRSVIGIAIVSIGICLLLWSESRTKRLYRADGTEERDTGSDGYTRGEFLTETVVIVLLCGALPAALARPKVEPS